jgi:hypothetical protein
MACHYVFQHMACHYVFLNIRLQDIIEGSFALQ